VEHPLKGSMGFFIELCKTTIQNKTECMSLPNTTRRKPLFDFITFSLHCIRSDLSFVFHKVCSVY